MCEPLGPQEQAEAELVDALIGSAVAKRLKHYHPELSDAMWFEVAAAATEVLHVAWSADDPLTALDDLFLTGELEKLMESES